MLNAVYIIYAFVFGAIFASFASAIAWRSHINESKNIFKSIFQIFKEKKYSIITGRSVCPNCKKTLKPISLIPIFSYLLQKGKCSYCKKHISIYYPLFESFSGIFLSILTAQYINNDISLYELVFFFVVFFLLVILSFQDIWFGEISDRIALPAIVFIFFSQLIYYLSINSFSSFWGFIEITILLFFIFGSIVIFTDAMGGGDLRVFSILGLALPFPSILICLTIAFILATLSGFFDVFIIKKQKDFLGYHVRLIPYLCLGYATVLICSNMILKIFYS